MNTWRLQCITAAAQFTTLQEAAASLGISQPALSKCITAASEDVGAPLFERGRRLRLTPAGEEYVAGALKILDIQKHTYELMRRLENAQAGHGFSMAFSPHIGVRIYSKAYPLFYEKHPDMQLTIHEGYFKENATRVFNGECDIAFGIRDNAFLKKHPMEIWPLYHTAWPLAVAEDHPLAAGGAESAFGSLPTIDLSLFRDVPFIGMDPRTHSHDIVDEITSQAGFTPLTIQATSDIFLAMELAACFNGYTFAVDSYCKAGTGLRYFLSDPPMDTTACFYFRPGLVLTPEMEEWIYLYTLQVVRDSPLSKIDQLPPQIQQISRRIGGVLHV